MFRGFYLPSQHSVSLCAFCRYVDGTGGCDGCLNWKNMGTRYPNATVQWRQKEGLELFEDLGKGDNNGLEYTVEVLEALYTDRTFPKV